MSTVKGWCPRPLDDGDAGNRWNPFRPFEEVVEDKGVRIFIDPKAILFLIGTELDFVQEKLGARFVFNNPNQTSACGCGESVQITPAQS